MRAARAAPWMVGDVQRSWCERMTHVIAVESGYDGLDGDEPSEYSSCNWYCTSRNTGWTRSLFWRKPIITYNGWGGVERVHYLHILFVISDNPMKVVAMKKCSLSSAYQRIGMHLPPALHVHNIGNLWNKYERMLSSCRDSIRTHFRPSLLFKSRGPSSLCRRRRCLTAILHP